MTHEAVHLSPSETAELLRQNSEMRRLLDEHQWSGITPLKSSGVCPECCGSSRIGHHADCALDAVLAAADLS